MELGESGESGTIQTEFSADMRNVCSGYSRSISSPKRLLPAPFAPIMTIL